MTILVAGEATQEALDFLKRHGATTFQGRIHHLEMEVNLYYIILPETARSEAYPGLRWVFWFDEGEGYARTEGIAIDLSIDALKTKITYTTLGE